MGTQELSHCTCILLDPHDAVTYSRFGSIMIMMVIAATATPSSIDYLPEDDNGDAEKIRQARL